MAFTYVPVNRDQLFLLPPNMKDWLEKDHLAFFVIDVVSKLDTAELHKRHPNDGVGRRAYNPEMLLALLIYAYCTKVRSSREIERFCRSDVAYRVLCADERPDHTTIARFRKDFADLAKKLFVDVLAIAQEAGAASVGVVALDGTKMHANASLKKNRSRQSLEDEVIRMMAEADKVDTGEDDVFGDTRGDELPEALSDPAKRMAALDNAIASLDAREQKEPTPTQQREHDKRIRVSRAREFRSLQRLRKAKAKERATRKRREATTTKTGKPWGRPRKHPETSNVKRASSDYEANKARRKHFEQRSASEAKSDPKANVTDPDSRVMQDARGAWIQGYNAQAAVNEDGIVVGAFVCNEPNDLNQLIPMIVNIAANLTNAGVIAVVAKLVADAGYHSEDNLKADGPERLIATGKSHTMRKEPVVTGPVPEGATALEANAHLLRTAEGKATYSKRQHMIEPVFGHNKGNKGFRTFMQRGLSAVEAEWNFMMAAHNVEKLYRRAN